MIDQNQAQQNEIEQDYQMEYHGCATNACFRLMPAFLIAGLIFHLFTNDDEQVNTKKFSLYLGGVAILLLGNCIKDRVDHMIRDCYISYSNWRNRRPNPGDNNDLENEFLELPAP